MNAPPKLRILVAALAILATARPTAGAKPPPDIHAASRKLGRGINLGNAFEAPPGAWKVTLKAEYFRTIKEAGFDTVRLPVKWSAHAQANAPYTIDADFATQIDWAVDQALANGLNIIVNLHHYREMDSDPIRNLPRLVALWDQIATRYKKRPAGVYFELLNEPRDNLIDERWNAAIPQILAAIRRSNPTRPVLVGPSHSNTVRGLDTLVLPKEDRNLILSVHFYDPFRFTHQGASWIKGADEWKGLTWTGSRAETAAIRSKLDKVATWAKHYDRPVFLGEFGAYRGADMNSRARWTRFVAREAENRGFSWAYWEFCSGFGAYDPKAEAWRAPLKAALLGR